MGVWSQFIATIWRYRLLYLMLLPAFAFYSVFRFYPMLGNVIAFKDYKVAAGIWGSNWVGLKHFQSLFSDALFLRALRNTISIGLLKLIFTFPAPILLALFLNEIQAELYKRLLQTIVYVPYFLSWVVYAAVLYIILSPATGVVNNFIAMLGSLSAACHRLVHSQRVRMGGGYLFGGHLVHQPRFV